MPSVAIVGASGYAGAELVRLVVGHPDLTLHSLAAGSNAGARLAEIHPQFAADPDVGSRLLESTNAAALTGADLIFTALPHGHSAALVAELDPQQPVIDLGADFRLAHAADWERYYAGKHAGQWIYGLPELPGQREAIAASIRVANPGCYATALQIGLAPLLADDLVEPLDIIAVAASGTSGAGRSAAMHLMASEVMGSMSVYKVGGSHQHTPEIEQSLCDISGERVQINFTPMLAPMSRGILATASVRTAAGEDDLRNSLLAAYQHEPFVAVLPEGQLPTTSATHGANTVQVQIACDQRTGRATVITALDNLVKGAAGQAVQNANLVLGLAETAGLPRIGVAP
jgi:N-acetyl-gamma-glutamyl-phosphate reductase